MLAYIRSAIFAVGLNLATVIYGSLVIFLIFFPPMLRHRILISWCWFIIVWARLICGVRYHIVGRENINKHRGAKVVLAKHQSTWETLALQYLFWPSATILKKELLSLPFFGWGLRCLQPIAINRSNPREALKQVKKEGIERLGSGMNLLLFPEGTRMPAGQKGKYARSGPDIAKAAGVPIVPVALDAGYLWPPKRFVKKPGLVTVIIGEPIMTDDKSSHDLIEQVEQWIENQQDILDRKRRETADSFTSV